LELEPTDVICAAAAGNEIVFQVVSNSAGLGINGVGAEIGQVAVKSGGFFFGCGAEQSFCLKRKRLAISLADNVDAHTARRVVHDQAGGPVIKVTAAGGIAFDGDQSPSANKLLGSLVWTGRGRGDGKTKENQEECGESPHRKAP
jgi:hypothetical protein